MWPRGKFVLPARLDEPPVHRTGGSPNSSFLTTVSVYGDSPPGLQSDLYAWTATAYIVGRHEMVARALSLDLNEVGRTDNKN